MRIFWELFGFSAAAGVARDAATPNAVTIDNAIVPLRFVMYLSLSGAGFSSTASDPSEVKRECEDSHVIYVQKV
ncbi:hypothetical protein GCM10027298_25240 [Epidermidibacterium keratini]